MSVNYLYSAPQPAVHALPHQGVIPGVDYCIRTAAGAFHSHLITYRKPGGMAMPRPCQAGIWVLVVERVGAPALRHFARV